MQTVSAMKKSNTSDSSGDRRDSGCSWCLSRDRRLSHSLTFSNSFGSGVMSFSCRGSQKLAGESPLGTHSVSLGLTT